MGNDPVQSERQRSRCLLPHQAPEHEMPPPVRKLRCPVCAYEMPAATCPECGFPNADPAPIRKSADALRVAVLIIVSTVMITVTSVALLNAFANAFLMPPSIPRFEQILGSLICLSCLSIVRFTGVGCRALAGPFAGTIGLGRSERRDVSPFGRGLLRRHRGADV